MDVSPGPASAGARDKLVSASADTLDPKQVARQRASYRREVVSAAHKTLFGADKLDAKRAQPRLKRVAVSTSGLFGGPLSCLQLRPPAAPSRKCGMDRTSSEVARESTRAPTALGQWYHGHFLVSNGQMRRLDSKRASPRGDAYVEPLGDGLRLLVSRTLPRECVANVPRRFLRDDDTAHSPEDRQTAAYNRKQFQSSHGSKKLAPDSPSIRGVGFFPGFGRSYYAATVERFKA